MTKFITFLMLVQIGTNANYAQVGIGTEEPEAMLDVAGTLQVRDETTLQAPLKLEYIESEEVTELTGNEIVLVADLDDEKIVKEVNLANLSKGLEVHTLNIANKSLYAAKISSGLTLLSIGLFNSWQPIIFPPQSKVVGNSEIVDANGVYTVPSNGIYEIAFTIRLGNGLQASLLSGSPQIGIIRRTQANNFSVLSNKSFPGVSVVNLLSLTISELHIHSVHELNQGDRLYFSLVRGGISLGLLDSSSSSYNIKKISGKIE